jgi:hypothetical protein
LGGLVASAEEKDQGLAPLNEIDPVSRALVDTHLEDTLANGRNIPEIASLGPVNPPDDLGPGPQVA